MAKFEHTFHYESEADLIQQLDFMLQKLIGRKMEHYGAVRERYGFHKSPAFCMRLKRFLRAGGSFPHVTGAKGKRIIKLSVTPALDLALRK